MPNVKRLALSFLIAAPLWSAAQETLNQVFDHDGVLREYIAYIPESYTGDEAVPLLFNFHGYGSNATEQFLYADFRSVADSTGCILICPDGLPDLVGIQHWNVGWGLSGNVDDIGFIDGLLDQLMDTYTIDENRVYSTGMSNGGYMSYHLACNLNERFTAVASVTGSMSEATLEGCTLSHVTPILQIHGTADGVVEYDGSAIATPIPEVMQFWRNANQTESEPWITELADVDPDDGSSVEHFVYEAGECNSRAELYKIDGGGHSWPGALIDIGATNYDFNGVTAVWNFLSEWSLADLGCAASVSDTPAEIQLQVHPNPTKDRVRLPYVDQDDVVTVTDLSGQLMLQFTGDSDIDLSALSSGVYLIEWSGRVARVSKQ